MASSLPVNLTERASQEVSHIMANKNIPEGYGLRIGVKGGGCAGVSYFIGFDQNKPTDEVFLVSDFQVFIEKKHFMHLLGVKVDFINSETERGFLFS
jgi:iron-sulfur cluster assembly protein